MDALSIGEVSNRVGLAPSAIRFYESAGLLAAPRRPSGRRAFDPGAVARLQVSSVEYRENYNGQAFEKEVHFWIKNTGSTTANFAVHMVQVRE